MATIEERAEIYANKGKGNLNRYHRKRSYIRIATEQKAIDIDKAKTAFGKACGWLSTYPWYNEVFEEFIRNMEEYK